MKKKQQKKKVTPKTPKKKLKKKTAKTVKRGAPTKLDKGTIKFVKHLAEQGCTHEEIAKEAGFCPKTLYNWKNLNPDFLQALQRGEAVAKKMVIAALFQKAVGYTHDEEKIVTLSGGMHGTSKWVRVDTIKHYPPELNAIRYWLGNKYPEEWRDKLDIDLIKKYEDMSEADLIADLKRMGIEVKETGKKS